MLSVKESFSVASLTSLLPFDPVWLSSASGPCPYPSCLCLPLRTSFFVVPISYVFSPSAPVAYTIPLFPEIVNKNFSVRGRSYK
jgi:hypothetical protein